jgi:hypothetical protein
MQSGPTTSGTSIAECYFTIVKISKTGVER